MKRKIGVTVLAFLLAAGMMGCTSTGQKEEKPKEETQQSTETKQEQTAEKPAEKPAEEKKEADSKPTGEKIVLYTNNGSDGRKEWVREEAAKAGFDVEVVELGGGKLTARVISEKNQPIADVVWGPSEAQFNSMKKEDILMQWTPTWVDQVEGTEYTKDGLSYPYEVQPKIMLANSELYTAETAPKDYPDLWEKEEFHGKYAVPAKFEGTTNRAILSGILVRYLDKDSETGISDEGWEALRQYFKYGYRTPEGENDFENMAKGKVPITFTFASGLKNKADAFHHNPLVITPAIGLPSNTNHIGIVKKSDTKKTEEAERFANWLCGGDTIGRYAQQFGILPANKEAVEQATDAMKELSKNMKAQDIDWEFVSEHIEDWISKIELEILE